MSRTLRIATVALLSFAVGVLGAARPAWGEDVGRWSWPLQGPHQVVRPFEAPDHRYGPGHRGIDVRGSTPTVAAVEEGTVRFASELAGRGVVSILHADGLISTYEPVTAEVSVGDAVSTGQSIGALEEDAVEASHCGGAVCLHLGARRGEQYIDPMLLLGLRGPSVLLPLGGIPGGRSGASKAPSSSSSSPAGGASPAKAAPGSSVAGWCGPAARCASFA